ncbi:hypothetical protein KU406_24285, partial [Salmonella enterica subsp. enterica serovar Montevideo]|nr:hypothetical protein [Salmonella enterica subsp. enterica serovar Montevideo]
DSEQEKDEGKRVIDRATGDLEFRNVTFTYPGREVPALRNINLIPQALYAPALRRKPQRNLPLVGCIKPLIRLLSVALFYLAG